MFYIFSYLVLHRYRIWPSPNDLLSKSLICCIISHHDTLYLNILIINHIKNYVWFDSFLFNLCSVLLCKVYPYFKQWMGNREHWFDFKSSSIFTMIKLKVNTRKLTFAQIFRQCQHTLVHSANDNTGLHFQALLTYAEICSETFGVYFFLKW